MVEGRRWEAWNHTAQQMALFANAHRDPKKRRRPFEPREFHQLMQKQSRRMNVHPVGSMSMIKHLFPKQKKA